MKLAALAMVVVAGFVFGGIFLFSNGHADKQLHPVEPISVSELSRRPVVGRLGHSLGEIVTIEGTVADGSSTRAKADEGKMLLRVQIVSGKRLEDEQVFHFQLASGARISIPKVGSKFKYRGYETGGFTGIPADAFQYIGMIATTRYGFTTSFLVVRDEKNRE